jgi:hypothetical protein
VVTSYKHGGYLGGVEHAEHYVWRAMIARCRRHPSYSKISVCKRWLDYKNFLADMGKRPSSKHSIERIDNEGNYEPKNCKWALRSEQQKNKRSTRRWERNGKIGTLVEWATRLGISKQLAHYRIKEWGTFERGRTWQPLQRAG